MKKSRITYEIDCYSKDGTLMPDMMFKSEESIQNATNVADWILSNEGDYKDVESVTISEYDYDTDTVIREVATYHRADAGFSASTRKGKSMKSVKKEEKKIPIADDDAVEIEEEDGKKVVEIESKDEHEEEVQSGEESESDNLNERVRRMRRMKTKKSKVKKDDSFGSMIDDYFKDVDSEAKNIISAGQEISNLASVSDHYAKEGNVSKIAQKLDDVQSIVEKTYHLLNCINTIGDPNYLASTKKSKLIKELEGIDNDDDEKHGCNCKAKRKWFAKEEEPESEDDELKSRKGYIRRARKSNVKKFETDDYSRRHNDDFIIEAIAREYHKFEECVKLEYIGTDWAMGAQYYAMIFKCKEGSFEKYAVITVMDWTGDGNRGIESTDYAYTDDIDEAESMFNSKIERYSRGTRKMRRNMKKAGDEEKSPLLDDVKDAKDIDSGKDIADEEKNCLDDVSSGKNIDDGNDTADEEKSALLDDVKSPKAKRKSVRKSLTWGDLAQIQDAWEVWANEHGHDAGSAQQFIDTQCTAYDEEEQEEIFVMISGIESEVEASRRKSVRKFSVTDRGGEQYDGKEKYNQSPMMRECIDRAFPDSTIKSMNDRLRQINSRNVYSNNVLAKRKVR